MRDSTRELIEKKKAEIALMEQEDGVNEFQVKNDAGWFDAKLPKWEFELNEYRLKPKPAECWIWVRDDGLIDGSTWPTKDFCKNMVSRCSGRAVLFREVTK
jgi:hypothetical protein